MTQNKISDAAAEIPRQNDLSKGYLRLVYWAGVNGGIPPHLIILTLFSLFPLTPLNTPCNPILSPMSDLNAGSVSRHCGKSSLPAVDDVSDWPRKKRRKYIAKAW